MAETPNAPVPAQRESAQASERKSGSTFPNIHRTRRGRTSKLKPFLRGNFRPVFDKILMFIEQGAYDHVAARAMGVHPQTWSRWMSQGAASEGGLYKEFYLEVIAARSKARLLAELQVRRDDPKFWLRVGPGKTKVDDPGWTENVAVVGDPEAEPVHMSHDEDVNQEDQINDLATTLLLLEQHGFATVTKHGKATVTQATRNKGGQRAVPTSHSPTPPDDDEDDDDPMDSEDKGYLPEKKQLKELSEQQKRKLLPGQSDLPQLPDPHAHQQEREPHDYTNPPDNLHW